MNGHFPIALHILGFLASRKGEPLTSDVLARTYGTSPVVLRRVLARLQRAGLVETQRGVGGGSLLARDPATITLRDAYAAVADETGILTRHPQGCTGQIAPVLASYVNDLLGDAEEAMLARLADVTVASMDIQIRATLARAQSRSTV
jgi:Rrf2 family protein